MSIELVGPLKGQWAMIVTLVNYDLPDSLDDIALCLSI